MFSLACLLNPQCLLITAGVILLLVLGKLFFNGGVCRYKPDLTGKVAIVTGGNAGIGKETSRELARLGATVIIACRDESKANETIKEITNETKNSKLEFIPLNLSDLQSVRQFVEKFNKSYKNLHLLINNAGIMALPQRQVSKHGFEMQIGTNHFGHFLLTNLLLPALKSSQPSRVINLTSVGHKLAKWDFDDLDCAKSYDPWFAYGNSKLANIYFTQELQNRLDGFKIKTSAVHPGGVRTELHLNFFSKYKVLNFLFMLVTPIWWYFSKSPKQGAQTTLYCALCDFDKLPDGKYFKDCSVATPSKLAQNAENARKLWEISEKRVDLK